MNRFTYDILKLAERKAQMGLTDQQLARRAKLHPTTIKNVLDRRTCNPPTIKLIAKALGIPMPDLVIPEPDVTVPAEPALAEREAG